MKTYSYPTHGLVDQITGTGSGPRRKWRNIATPVLPYSVNFYLVTAEGNENGSLLAARQRRGNFILIRPHWLQKWAQATGIRQLYGDSAELTNVFLPKGHQHQLVLTRNALVSTCNEHYLHNLTPSRRLYRLSDVGSVLTLVNFKKFVGINFLRKTWLAIWHLVPDDLQNILVPMIFRIFFCCETKLMTCMIQIHLMEFKKIAKEFLITSILQMSDSLAFVVPVVCDLVHKPTLLNFILTPRYK